MRLLEKNKKESYDAQEEAKRAEEAAERVRRTGTFTEILLRFLFLASD
jgi:hypothetical protein